MSIAFNRTTKNTPRVSFMLKSLDRECHSAGMKKYSLNDKQIPFSHFRNMKDFECESPIKINNTETENEISPAFFKPVGKNHETNDLGDSETLAEFKMKKSRFQLALLQNKRTHSEDLCSNDTSLDSETETEVEFDKKMMRRRSSLKNLVPLPYFLGSNPEKINEELIRTILRKILAEMRQMHQNQISLGKLNMEQIFVSHDAKIIKLELLQPEDFSLKIKDKIQEIVTSEIWNVGIIFLKMAKNLGQSKNLNVYKLLQFISNGDFVEELALSDCAWDLMRKMLTKKPKERISVNDAVEHEWFSVKS